MRRRGAFARLRRPTVGRRQPVVFFSAIEGGDDGVHVVDAAAPGAAARLLERGPEPRVVGQVGIGREVGPGRPRREHARALLGAEHGLAVADQVDRALQAVPVHDDLDEVAVQHAADGTAGEGLRADVADARAGGHAGEAGVGEDGDLLAPRQVLERGGDLVDLLHPGADGAATDEDHDVTGLHPVRALALDGGDGRALPREHARRPALPVHAVGVHHATGRWPCS